MTPEEIIEILAADPGAAGLFLDFDGTLAAIVDDPATVRLDVVTHGLLERLAAVLSTVAVVSGRPASFLLASAAVPGVRMLGLYGLEVARDGAVVPRAELAGWQGAVSRAGQWLADELEGHEGLYVEDKGRAVAVHWRNAPDPEAARMLVEVAVSGVAEATGLAVQPGKLVAELRPPVEWDKGSAVAATADEEGLREVVYVGDDHGDLPAFAAVHARGGVAVGVEHGEETPAGVHAEADVMLNGTDGVRAWLAALSDRLSSEPAG